MNGIVRKLGLTARAVHGECTHCARHVDCLAFNGTGAVGDQVLLCSPCLKSLRTLLNRWSMDRQRAELAISDPALGIDRRSP